MDHDTALASAAALTLAQGPHEARLDLARALADHGFGTSAPMLEDPNRNESIEREVGQFGAASSQVSRELTPLRTVRGGDIRHSVEGRIDSANDLEARGQAAAESFFRARKEENSAKVELALAELGRVIDTQRAAHFESTFEETRGFLKAIQDFDLAGQFGDFEINASALSEAARSFYAARGEAASAGSNPRDAMIIGLLAGFRGYAKGFDDAVEARREQAFEEATALGLPESAARFYADQRVLLQESLDKSVPRLLGNDAEFERLKDQTMDEIGEKGADMLSRAATAEPVAKKYYLDGASAIYRSRHPAVSETSVP